MIDLFLIAGIIVLGIVTSYTDILHKKIYNKHVLVAIVYGVIVNFIFWLLGEVNMLLVLSNFLIAVVFSFVLYKLGIWAAGDAKLMMAFSLLLPLSFYSNFYVPQFPSFILFTNVFLLATFLVFLTIIPVMLKYSKTFAVGFFSKKMALRLVGSFGGIFSFAWIFRALLLDTRTPATIFFSMALAYFFYFLISKTLIKSNTLRVGVYIVAFLIGLFFGRGFHFRTLTTFALFSIVLSGFHNIAKTFSTVSKRDSSINKHLALAPYMFAGVLITLLIQGEVITWLSQLI